jgi:hypothetical protein
VRIDLEDLRRHYAELSDEELEEIEAADLTEAARAVYQAEFARRKLPSHEEPDHPLEGHDGNSSIDRPSPIEDAPGEFEIDVGPPPKWLEDAACACSFATRPGNTDLPEALKARLVLRRAGIPCRLTVQREQDDADPPAADPASQSLLCVMVPGALALHATSILDREIFNDEKEAEWRNHFEGLSDAELSALDPEIFCSGYLDLVERLRRAYDDEIARRQLTPGDTGSRRTAAGG